MVYFSVYVVYKICVNITVFTRSKTIIAYNKQINLFFMHAINKKGVKCRVMLVIRFQSIF